MADRLPSISARPVPYDAPPVIAVDLGATHLRMALAGPDHLGPVVVRRTAELARHPREGTVPAIVEVVRAVAEGACPKLRPSAAGVGIAGFVGPGREILERTRFDVPSGSVLQDRLAEALGVPVIVDNDAKMAALGEQARGAGRGQPDFVLITLGTYIGGAIVSGGRLIRGAHGIAGEVGMLLIQARRMGGGRGRIADAGSLGRGETVAPPGYAWLEELVGGAALARSSLPDGVRPGPAAGIFARAAAGDSRAGEAVRRAIEGWAVLVADVSICLDPGLVILSGGLTEDAHHFMEPLRRRVAQLSPFPPEIRIGELGAYAGLIGAAESARIAASQAVGPLDREPDKRLATTRR